MACPLNGQPGCRHPPCPLNIKRLKDLLDIYFDGVSSADWDKERVDKGPGDAEIKLVFRAQIYKLFFNDEGFDAVLQFYLSGEKTITRAACDELHRIKERWVEQTNKEFAEKNQEFREACKRVGIEPTARQAARWRHREGLAWKEGRIKEGQG